MKTAWKPIAITAAIVGALMIAALTTQANGMPSAVGWIILAVLAAAGLLLLSRF